MQRIYSGVIIIFLVLLFFSGCEFDYEESVIAEELSEETPETILKNFSQVMVRDSIPTFYIEASESRSYKKKNETIFADLHFQEYDKDGSVITDGTADNAKLFNETENVELWGNLNFYSSQEEARINGEYLFWNNEKSVLEGKEDDRINIIENSGSSISGIGFYANSSKKEIHFTDGVSGTWADE